MGKRSREEIRHCSSNPIPTSTTSAPGCGRHQPMPYDSSTIPAKRWLPARPAAFRSWRRLKRPRRAAVPVTCKPSTPVEQHLSEASVSSPTKPSPHRSRWAAVQGANMDHVRRVFVGPGEPSNCVNLQSLPSTSALSKRRHQWTKVQDRKLVEVLLHNLHTGTIEANKFKDVVLQAIEQELSNFFTVTITPSNVKNRVHGMRKIYGMYCTILNKTGMRWKHHENRFDGPLHVWNTLIERDNRYKRLMKPQHLSYDDLHELFRGNRATGEYMRPGGSHSTPPYEDIEEEEHEDDFSMETPHTEETIIGSSEHIATPVSSGTPIGGSFRNDDVRDENAESSRGIHFRRTTASVRRRRQQLMEQFANICDTYFGQPPIVTFKHSWQEDLQSLPELLRSMGLSSELRGAALLHFTRHPFLASTFVNGNDNARADWIESIRQAHFPSS